MENIQNREQEPVENLDPQEKLLEEEALKSPIEDELRAEVIERYGLDEVENSELIASLVSDKLADKKKLSTAIRQKIKYRGIAQAPKEQKPEVKPQLTPQSSNTDADEILRKVDERLAQKELDSLELEDSLKEEVKNYALLNKVSYKNALKSPYIQFRVKELEDKARIEEATIGSTHKTMVKKDFSEMSPGDFDMATPEGREEFAKYRKHLNENQVKEIG